MSNQVPVLSTDGSRTYSEWKARYEVLPSQSIDVDYQLSMMIETAHNIDEISDLLLNYIRAIKPETFKSKLVEMINQVTSKDAWIKVRKCVSSYISNMELIEEITKRNS